jgi:hypothetical protein
MRNRSYKTEEAKKIEEMSRARFYYKRITRVHD